MELNQGRSNFLTSGPQSVPKLDREARPAAQAWSVLGINHIRERNNMESGQKHALVLMENQYTVC